MSDTTDGQVRSSATPVQVEIAGETAPDVAAYAERRLRHVLHSAPLPVLHARIRVTRHPDPAMTRPVVAEANLDVNGRLVRAQLSAPTAREAIDLLHDRLRHRLQHVVQRTAGNWEDRRARRTAGKEHEWRHGDEPTQRPPYRHRPPDEREIVRHKTVTPARCGIDEAAADMDDMGYDFHLFTEAGTRQDGVLYRSGAAGYRLTEVEPQPVSALATHTLPVTVSDQPAPRLTVPEAVQRMALSDQPFLFFRDEDQARGALLYLRYDGHYGVITPGEPSPGGRTQSRR